MCVVNRVRLGIVNTKELTVGNFFFMISKLFHSRSDTLTRVAKT